MSNQLPKRTGEELARDLRERAGLLSGQMWEAPATAAMMLEAAECIEALLGQHEAGCPAIADDESDYEHLDDAGICVCRVAEYRHGR